MKTVCIRRVNPSHRWAPRVWAAAAGVLLAVPFSQAEPSLSASSPFLPGPAAAAAATAAPAEYELAGASATSHSATVCIYDTQQKRSHWIPVGETDGPIQVLKYDAVNDEALVKVNGAPRLLVQRRAKVVAGAYLPPPVAMTAPGTSRGFTAPAPPIVNPADAGKSAETLKQEKDARMLVSDLLEIGLEQRKAYEAALKKAGKGS